MVCCCDTPPPLLLLPLGEGLRTGDADPLLLLFVLGLPSRRIIVDEIVLRAACFARSVLTKLVTNSSRLPLKFGEASSSSGTTSVVKPPLVVLPGDVGADVVGDETAAG